MPLSAPCWVSAKAFSDGLVILGRGSPVRHSLTPMGCFGLGSFLSIGLLVCSCFGLGMPGHLLPEGRQFTPG